MLTRWWFQICFTFTPFLGKSPILTNVFQMGWFNHQLDYPLDFVAQAGLPEDGSPQRTVRPCGSDFDDFWCFFRGFTWMTITIPETNIHLARLAPGKKRPGPKSKLVHPRSLIVRPLKNDVWKTTLLLGMVIFSRAMVNFQGVQPSIFRCKQS